MGVKRLYEETHKIIDGVMYKLCLDCSEWYPLNEEYFYKNNSSPDGYFPYCKEDAKKRSTQNKVNNIERYNKYMNTYMKTTNKGKNARKNWLESQGKRINQIKWQHNNPDKVRGYNKDRSMNKKHEIADQEWFDCLDYFNNSCAYCNLSEEEQIKLYGEQFHKEHVIHNGSNYIDNCVPSCTSCNTSKHDSELINWYNKDNPNFKQERLDKIVKWMTDECFKTLNLK